MSENGSVELGEAKEVRVQYVDVEKDESESTAHATDLSDNTKTEENDETQAETQDDEKKEDDEKVENAECGDDDKKDEKEDVTKASEDDKKDDVDDEDKKDADCAVNEEDDDKNKTEEENAAKIDESEAKELSNSTENKDEEGAANVNEATTNTDTPAFTDSERQEFEALKRQQKELIIASYQDDLPEDMLVEFTNNIDNFDADSLEAELAKKYRTYSKNHSRSKRGMRTFSFIPNNGTQSNQQQLVDLVNQYKTKR